MNHCKATYASPTFWWAIDFHLWPRAVSPASADLPEDQIKEEMLHRFEQLMPQVGSYSPRKMWVLGTNRHPDGSRNSEFRYLSMKVVVVRQGRWTFVRA